LACVAAPMAQAPAMTQSSTNSGAVGTRGRSPQVNGTISAEASAASNANDSMMNICGCRRRVPSRRTN
jgi:hypothetical protein